MSIFRKKASSPVDRGSHPARSTGSGPSMGVSVADKWDREEAALAEKTRGEKAVARKKWEGEQSAKKKAESEKAANEEYEAKTIENHRNAMNPSRLSQESTDANGLSVSVSNTEAYRN